MPTAVRRIALVGLSPDIAQDEGMAAERPGTMLTRFPSYGLRRIQAALTAGAGEGVEIAVLDRRSATAGEVMEWIVDLQPDLVGLSAYVWSTPLMAEVARRVKLRDPDCTVIVGGPSAHPQVFDLEPFRSARGSLDALVLGEGEETVRQIAALEDRSPESLCRVSGLAIPTPGGWHRTAKRIPNPDLDALASPFQSGLMPREHVAYLETFRGCPLSCTFCQWGVMDSNRFHSEAYLTRELEALKSAAPPYTYLVDAALNLNLRAFRNLAAAEKRVGFFRDSPLLCEVYPSFLTDEHLAFLSGVCHLHVGLGVQSLDAGVLNATSRPFRPERLRPAIEQLSRFGLVDVEIILGLPGDTPETFFRTLEQVLELPCNVRVFRCLILPDALMSRAPRELAIRFDPRTLMMTSCHTWPERELQQAQNRVTRLAESLPGGYAGEYWWHFVTGRPEYQQSYDRLAGQPGIKTSTIPAA